MVQFETQKLGTVLIVSRDDVTSSQISDVLRTHGLSVEHCLDVPAALDRLTRRKFEAVVVDLAFNYQAVVCLQQIRASSSNRTAVTFAITGGSDETARGLKDGFSFALEKPLTSDSITRTLKAAYGLIIRERRRYFRYPVDVPAVLCRNKAQEVYGRTINISESGIALRMSTALSCGDEGAVEFTLPAPPMQVKAECRVCWCNSDGEAGLAFLFLPLDMASQLQAWLAQKLEQQMPPSVADRFWQCTQS